ncbi:DsbC family protein [Halioxenophilus aromaticivorans]|uniref:Thiol:disulfide interchange protein n=1 Tax=Halioxenophilus aromaticivorans TaxID=1306992 RepID=A0AAV3TZJ5_9ALTE
MSRISPLKSLLALAGGAVMAALITLPAQADEQSDVDQAAVKAITQGLAKARPQLTIESIDASPIPGLYRAQIEGGPVLFVSADGNYMLATDMYQIVPGNFVNLQEVERKEMRAELAAQLDKNHEDLIVYSPKGEVKGVVNVFTDVDCGYCQKLHKEIPALNDMGIELRYLAYPRAGIGSTSYNKIASAWCAKDQNKAMDKLKARQDIDTDVCEGNPVAEHFLAGNKIGVSGTPAILLSDGTLLPGYLPAKDLAARIGIEDKQAAVN